MERDELIPAAVCCQNYQLETSFITWLNEHELLELKVIEEETYIPYNQLGMLEQFIRMHHDLDINLEGIEAISHLLQRMQNLQHELNLLRNKLRLYQNLQEDA